MRTSVYAMIRDGEKRATVVVLPNGRCVVSWPTSTIVYDSEKAARDVHIYHMGGRGEQTRFELETSTSSDFRDGVLWCQMDHWENAPFASVGGPGADPMALSLDAKLKGDRIESEVIAGYESQAECIYGKGWRENERLWPQRTQQVRKGWREHRQLLDWPYALLRQAQYRRFAKRVFVSVCGKGTEMNWRTIDSAPKDGTRLLLCRATDEAQFTGSWCDCYGWSDLNAPIAGVTHWMPLPAPPEETK